MQVGHNIVFSPEAKALHFGVSLLKRLFEEYQRQAQAARGIESLDWLRQETTNEWGLVNNPFMCTLTDNYRSKPEIVRFLSTVFYNGPDRLKAVGNLPDVLSGPCQPALCFYVALGKEEVDETDLSWYNQAEIDELVDRVKMVVEFWPQEWGPKNPAEVCVVSYYLHQVRLIRHRFRRTGGDLANVNVETMMGIHGI